MSTNESQKTVLFISELPDNILDAELEEFFSAYEQDNDISEDEYFYLEGIADKFSPNLKIRIPIFQPHDIFHLFFKYDNNDKYKMGDVLDEKTKSFGKISNKIIKLLDKEFKNAKDITNEIGCFLYEEITGDEIWTTPKIIVENMEKRINSKNLDEKKRITKS